MDELETVEAVADLMKVANGHGAEAERAAIVKLCRDRGLASVNMILAAGLPGGTRTERVKRAAYADGYSRAIADLRDAIERLDHIKPVGE